MAEDINCTAQDRPSQTGSFQIEEEGEEEEGEEEEERWGPVAPGGDQHSDLGQTLHRREMNAWKLATRRKYDLITIVRERAKRLTVNSNDQVSSQ